MLEMPSSTATKKTKRKKAMQRRQRPRPTIWKSTWQSCEVRASWGYGEKRCHTELLTSPCDQTARCLPNGLDALSTMTLCPSLSFFRFSDAQLDLGLLNLGFDDDDNGGDALPASASHRQPDVRHLASGGDDDEDMGGFDDPYLNQDFGGGGGDDDEGAEVDFFADQFSGEAAAFGLQGATAPIASGSGAGGGGGGSGFGAVEPFDPRRMADERDIVMSMDGEGDGMFAYFDAKLGKNWAGPEHWKMRRGVAAAKKGGRSSGVHERHLISDSFDPAQTTRLSPRRSGRKKSPSPSTLPTRRRFLPRSCSLQRIRNRPSRLPRARLPAKRPLPRTTTRCQTISTSTARTCCACSSSPR